MKREETNDLEKIGTVRRSRMTTEAHTEDMKGFMRVICVILCLLISTSVPAYAESILWSSKHVITNLAKDEEWLAATLLTEEQDADPPAEDM